jgi:hypothetical protein
VCTVNGLGSGPSDSIKKYTVEYTVTTKKAFDSILSGNVVLKTSYDWLVIEKPASYNLKLDNMFPEDKDGNGEATTNIIKEETPFPWWIVVISLLVSVIIVSLVVVLLYKKGFFTKRDMDKIRLDEIKDDDVVDAENEEFVFKSSGV